MDPLSIIASVCALTTALQTWLSARSDQSEIIRSLSFTITRIGAVLGPFQAPDVGGRLGTGVVDCCRGLGEALSRTREHLVLLDGGKVKGSGAVEMGAVVLGSSASSTAVGSDAAGCGNSKTKLTQRVANFLRPAEVVKKLQADERQLTNQLVLVLFAITAQTFFAGAAGTSGVVGEGEMAKEEVMLTGVENREVREFWRDYVGAKVVCVPPTLFIASLKTWYRSGLPESTCTHLLLRLDEYSVGGVTPSSLESLAGEKGLREVIDGFRKQNEPKEDKPSLFPSKSMPLATSPRTARRPPSPSLPAYTEYPDLPLLIWVDDRPENNIPEADYARSLGVTVVELTSTALAKAWFEENEEFVRANDHPSRLRVISDNARYESDLLPLHLSPARVSPASAALRPSASHYLNPTAGESLLRYLRGHQHTMPVLVYCGYSIRSTEYVRQYEAAGSCTSPDVVRRFVRALGEGRGDDSGWMRFWAS